MECGAYRRMVEYSKRIETLVWLKNKNNAKVLLSFWKSHCELIERLSIHPLRIQSLNSSGNWKIWNWSPIKDKYRMLCKAIAILFKYAHKIWMNRYRLHFVCDNTTIVQRFLKFLRNMCAVCILYCDPIAVPIASSW